MRKTGECGDGARGSAIASRAGAAMLAPVAAALVYPQKPIRVIAPHAPSCPIDIDPTNAWDQASVIEPRRRRPDVNSN